MDKPESSDAAPLVYRAIEESAVVQVVNARAVEMVKMEERLRTLQLFDTVDADGKEIKRSRRLRGDSVDIQMLLERSARYQRAEKEADDAAELMRDVRLSGIQRAQAMMRLSVLRDQQTREIYAMEMHRGNMRRDYAATLHSSIKMLSDAAAIRQRERHHYDEMEILKARQVDPSRFSDSELERQEQEASKNADA